SSPALSFTDSPEHFTWAQLRAEVGRIASGLVSAGVRPGDKVGIMVPNQPEFPLAWLAVIDAGAVAVPLNPRYTSREAEFVLAAAGPPWLVIPYPLLRSMGAPPFGRPPPAHVIVVGEPVAGAHRFGDLRDTPETARRHRAQVSDVVGIQFTSGT